MPKDMPENLQPNPAESSTAEKTPLQEEGAIERVVENVRRETEKAEEDINAAIRQVQEAGGTPEDVVEARLETQQSGEALKEAQARAALELQKKNLEFWEKKAKEIRDPKAAAAWKPGDWTKQRQKIDGQVLGAREMVKRYGDRLSGNPPPEKASVPDPLRPFAVPKPGVDTPPAEVKVKPAAPEPSPPAAVAAEAPKPARSDTGPTVEIPKVDVKETSTAEIPRPVVEPETSPKEIPRSDATPERPKNIPLANKDAEKEIEKLLRGEAMAKGAAPNENAARAEKPNKEGLTVWQERGKKLFGKAFENAVRKGATLLTKLNLMKDIEGMNRWHEKRIGEARAEEKRAEENAKTARAQLAAYKTAWENMSSAYTNMPQQARALAQKKLAALEARVEILDKAGMAAAERREKLEEKEQIFETRKSEAFETVRDRLDNLIKEAESRGDVAEENLRTLEQKMKGMEKEEGAARTAARMLSNQIKANTYQFPIEKALDKKMLQELWKGMDKRRSELKAANLTYQKLDARRKAINRRINGMVMEWIAYQPKKRQERMRPVSFAPAPGAGSAEMAASPERSSESAP